MLRNGYNSSNSIDALKDDSKQENKFLQLLRFMGIWVILFLIGTVLLIYSAVNYIAFENNSEFNNFKKSAEKTTAVITNIGQYAETGDVRATVVYNVGGNEYEEMITNYPTSWHKGDKIDLYYDKNNPSSCMTQTRSNGNNEYGFMLKASPIIILLSVLLASFKNYKNKEYLNIYKEHKYANKKKDPTEESFDMAAYYNRTQHNSGVNNNNRTY